MVGSQYTEELIKSLEINTEKANDYLDHAIYIGNDSFINVLLETGGDPSKSSSRTAALHTAARWGLTSIMEKMAAKVADLRNSLLLHSAANRELSNIQMIKCAFSSREEQMFLLGSAQLFSMMLTAHQPLVWMPSSKLALTITRRRLQKAPGHQTTMGSSRQPYKSVLVHL